MIGRSRTGGGVVMAEVVKSPRGGFALAVIGAGLSAMFVALVALGAWQVQRLGWKQDLIRRVEARVHAAPGPAPERAQWATVSAERDEYRRVRLHGRYLPDRNTLVQAVTELGPGFWLLTPFRGDDGTVVLVNRGYVPSPREVPDEAGRPLPDTQVVGLLRLSEPGGGFLRKNDPGQDRWYSRDVAAIAAKRGLGEAAPFFVDAERNAPLPADPAQAPSWPVGGLTVVKFPDNHLVYALTWFGLALMVAFAGWRVAVEERRRRAAAASG